MSLKKCTRNNFSTCKAIPDVADIGDRIIGNVDLHWIDIHRFYRATTVLEEESHSIRSCDREKNEIFSKTNRRAEYLCRPGGCQGPRNLEVVSNGSDSKATSQAEAS